MTTEVTIEVKTEVTTEITTEVTTEVTNVNDHRNNRNCDSNNNTRKIAIRKIICNIVLTGPAKIEKYSTKNIRTNHIKK